MRKIVKIQFTFILAVAMLFGCNEVLETTPRNTLTPATFTTPDGLKSGLTAAYARYRPFYGHQGGAFQVSFSDEYLNAQQISDNPLSTYVGIDPGLGDISVIWNDAYPAINTCNGIIELGPEATGLLEEEKTQLIGEARFVRAHWYFLLAQTYGGATLDLGSGPLAFNSTPTSSLTRNTEEEVMEAVIADLEQAKLELLADKPLEAGGRGRAWRATALHVLAKAYLWRASMPYGPAANQDFQAALDNANELINNSGAYDVALLANYADIFEEGNEWNSEVLWTINWNGDAQFNNAEDSGNGTNNIRQFFFREFYVQDTPGMIRDVENGRPWIRFSPTAWMVDIAFADKTNDERYNASFQTVWLANDTDDTVYPVWDQADVDAGYVDASLLGEPKFGMGDTAQWHAPLDFQESFASAAERNAWVESKGYVVTFPTAPSPTFNYFDGGRNSQNKHFPSASQKFDAKERPIAGTEEDPNIGSTRPQIVYRFAETYLVAAEAALGLGQPGTAADFINVIRARAGASTITAGDMSGVEPRTGVAFDEIDFILDERTRELTAEHMRWYDLKRTGRLLSRVSADPAVGTSVSAVYNRQFNGGAPAAGQLAPMPQPHHLLRPVPQGSIDATVGGYPQNPGYN